MEEQEATESKTKSYSWIVYIILATIFGVAGFFLGRLTGYDHGYFAGAIFGDSSGYKRGQKAGFDMGYELRDSMARADKNFSMSQNFNLNIINEEVRHPEEFISVSGEIADKAISGSYFASSTAKMVNVSIVNTAQYARYRNIKISGQYLGKMGDLLGEKTIALDEILYPGKKIVLPISPDEVPQNIDKVNFSLKSAEGID